MASEPSKSKEPSSFDSPRNRFPEEYERQLNLELQRDTLQALESDAQSPPPSYQPSAFQECPSSPLQRGLQIPTRSSHLTSGFQYPDLLQAYSITSKDWSSFTSELITLAHLSSHQWSTIVLKGAGATAVGSLLVGGFGLVPGYITGKKSRQHAEERNILAAEESGQLQATVTRWNEEFFRPRGILVRIDLPGRGEDMGAMDVASTRSYRKVLSSGSRQSSPTFGEPSSTSEASSTRSNPSSSRASRKEYKERSSAARRGRIVVLPLDQQGEGQDVKEIVTVSPANSAQPNIESLIYEQRSGVKDFWPDEPKP
ncbi:MAG: hypothetical protein M1834_007568 [Cirrosporium novae-zelandiae]|nr:MAG: hypothetical protein M1834_007568 [Cirrosporium novae-zelandiae]